MQRKEVVGPVGIAMDHLDHLQMMIRDGAMVMAERSSLEPMHAFSLARNCNRDHPKRFSPANTRSNQTETMQYIEAMQCSKIYNQTVYNKHKSKSSMRRAIEYSIEENLLLFLGHLGLTLLGGKL
jgi:hypothetical protein